MCMVIQMPFSTVANNSSSDSNIRDMTLVSYLVVALNPVSHKRLYQGWKQTSIHLLVIHSTNHYTTCFFFSNHNSNDIHNFGTQTKTNSSTYLGAYLYSAGTQHGTLHQLSVTTSGAILFILRAHAGTGVGHSQYKKNLGEVLKKNANEWTGRVRN